MTHHDVDVVVVGFGPVGTTLSALLARRGLRVLAVDRDTELFPLPRAAHIDHEIMRILQEVGCADAVAPATIINAGMDFLAADRQVLLSMRPPVTTPSGWPASTMFHQPGLEQPMRDAAVASGIATRLGTAVTAVVDRGDHAVVGLEDGSEVTAAIVVGCDGARSSVRKQLGIEMDDLQFEEPWLVLDLVLHDGVEPPASVALQVCDPARPHTLVPMPAPRFRFEFMLLPGEDPAAINTPDTIRSLLAAWIDPDQVTIERSAVYTFHGLIAQRWRQGRVLLAGDAAHQMPPFLGQGMCSGMRDAANLAWKLDRVVRGFSPVELLDTYQAEREPHVRTIVELAVSFGRLICTTDAAVAAERDAGMLAARAAGGGTAEGGTSPTLPDGPLVAPGGTQVHQPEVDGVRLDDLIGDRFAVLVRHAALASGDAADWWRAFGAVVLDAEAHPTLIEALDAGGADTVIVRPDRYILAAGSALTVPSPEALALLTV
ncbi:MAG: bifunctional 3-(3-hydroxy-phenyl)propionate/3-hydroxycinnamic acid hydroxylase [Ilumatobacteraceae bacterium]